MIHLAVDHGKKFSHAVAMSDSVEVIFDGQVASTIRIAQTLRPGSMGSRSSASFEAN